MNETAYDHIAGDGTFTVTAAERWSRNMVLKLKEKYPNEVEIVCENDDGCIVAHVPAAWMRIVPKRHIELTEEQRKERAERMMGIKKEAINGQA